MTRHILNRYFFLLSLAMHFHWLFCQFSPGDLAEKHKQLTGNQYCAECHSKGKTVDAQDCLNCHTPVENRINLHSGYHGVNNETNCIKCHSDHNGNSFQMIFWENGRDNFQHDKTGYTLKGKHKTLDCNKCHNPKYVLAQDVLNWKKDSRSRNYLSTTFLGLPAECSGCHEDIHRKKSVLRQYSVFKGKVCNDCHNQENWNEAGEKFDHSTTKFQLKLSHAKLNCIKCHPDKTSTDNLDLTFSDTYEKFECIQCHKDAHEGSFGNICGKCHAEDDWKKPLVFDHEKTNFPLKSKHAEVLCVKCHTPGKNISKSPACRDCHKDIHQNQFFADSRWKDCSPCHRETGWTPSYFSFRDHNQSQFPLTGAHQAVPCILCHTTPPDTTFAVRYSRIEHRCTSCHDSIHDNQFLDQITQNDCISCHTTEAWKITSFDHSRTRYPLDGQHANVACAKCHKPEDVVRDGTVVTIIRYTPIGMDCADCHLDQLYK